MQNAVVNVAWSLAERYGVQCMGLAVTLCMARLLGPEEFGTIAIVFVAISVSALFVESGLSQAYVQKLDATEIDANTILITNITLGCIIYLSIWFLAQPIAAFYNNPLLVDLFRITGLIIILTALRSVHLARLIKQKNFKLKSKLALASTALSGITGVFAALLGMGVWSLAIQHLSFAVLMCISLWLFARWRLTLSYSLRSLAKLYRYGFWVIAAALLRVLSDAFYILLIGRVFPVAELGLYSQATQLSRMSGEQFAGAVGAVTFPMLAENQNDQEKLRKLMTNYLKYTAFILSCALCLLVVVSPALVSILLTPKWASMANYLQLLSIPAFLLPIHAINIYVIQAIGKSELNFVLSLVKSALRVIALLITYQWGIAYIILGELVVSVLSLFINTYHAGLFLNFPLGSQISLIAKTYFCATLAIVFGLVVTGFTQDLLTELITGSITVIGIYAIGQYTFNRATLLEIESLRTASIGAQRQGSL